MDILKELGKYESFLTTRDKSDEQKIAEIFEAVAKEVCEMKEEKLTLPCGFVRDLRLYTEKKPEIVKYFEDIEQKYLLLTDLYGYCRVKGKI
jgi:hypothetical protein